jgi:hypothetical protein
MRKSIRSSLCSTPALLFVVVLLAYGIFIPWFGFYGDDWIYMHNFHQAGAFSFNQFVAADRPFSGWVYVLTTPLFGEQAWPYHVFLLALRWLSAVLLWWVLKMVWPSQKWRLTAAAAIFAVFPGFLQHPIAVQYILHFSILDLFLLSLGWMAKAAGERPGSRRFWLFYGGSLLAGLGIFSIEYFVGLELLRPIWLWVVLRRKPARSGDVPAQPKKMFGRLAGLWAPFLGELAAFGVWRALIFKFPTYQPTLINNFAAHPASEIAALLKRILTDLVKVNMLAWKQAIGLPGADGSAVFFGALILATFALVVWLLREIKNEETTEATSSLPVTTEERDRETTEATSSLPVTTKRGNGIGTIVKEWPVQAMGLGVFAMLIAGWPFWIAGVPMETSFPWDRTMLPFMFGVCLTLVGAVDLLIRPRFQLALLAVLTALAVGGQYRNALVYRGERDALNAYFWQLVWRAPGLKSGTIVASDAIPLFRFSDNDLTPVLDWMYAPEKRGKELGYQYFDLSLRLGEDIQAETGQTVKHSYRGFNFSGSSSDVLVVFNRASGCLHVLSPQDTWHPGLPATVKEMAAISNLNVIDVGSVSQPSGPVGLGSEPAHDWCYSFEKADLARQEKDWNAIHVLADNAPDLAQIDPFELLPFVEGLALSGDIERAQQWSDQARQNPAYLPGVCNAWKDVLANSTDTVVTARAGEIRTGYGCSD